MKEKMKQMFKDKLLLVMMVLGLLTIVAAAGVATMNRGGVQEEPYVDMQEQGEFLASDPTLPPVAGESNAQEMPPVREAVREPENPDTAAAEQTYAYEPPATEALEAGGGLEAATALSLDFSDSSLMQWPIRGNVVLDYSMDSTIYFPTLEQYQCNPGIVIQGEISEPVYAPANARVVEAGANEEIGSFVRLDLGNGYSALCGQLKDMTAVEGEYLEKGQLLGYVAEPTKYYSLEGSNLYFELRHEEQTLDPLDYME